MLLYKILNSFIKNDLKVQYLNYKYLEWVLSSCNSKMKKVVGSVFNKMLKIKG